MLRIAPALAALLAFSCAPPSAWNMPPIVEAARSGDTAQLEELLGEGADPNIHAGVNHWTPLLHAIHKNQEGSVRVLLAHGADVDLRGGGGVTPLIMASGYGYANIVRVLLDSGADAQLTANDGADALTAAMSGVPDIDRFTVGQCQTETVRTLLAADRSLRLTPDNWTRTSLAITRLAGCRDLIGLLKQRQESRQ